MDAISSRPAKALAAAVVVVASASCVAALLLADGAPVDLPDGIADAGPVVGWGSRLTRLAGLLAGVLTIGSLLVAAWLGTATESVPRALRAARVTATAWVVTGLLGYVLGVCDIAGLPLSSVSPATLLAGWTASLTAAHLVSVVLAAVVAVGAVEVGSSFRARVLLVVGLATALPVPLVGHVASAGDGGVSLSGLVVHVTAALVWTGGLTGLLLHLRADRHALAVAAPRYSSLALGAYVALAVSGLIAASGALPFTGPGWEAAWVSGYAGLVAAKVAVLVLLGAMGFVHRRRTLPRIAVGEPHAFLRLAAFELLVMGAAAGLAAGLAHTPVPPRTVTDHGASTVAVEELSVVALLATWRPNAVVLLVLGSALTWYLHSRRRLAAAGQPWPRCRTGCFATGVALASAALCSGVVTYASMLLSVHLAQLLVMLLVVPPLLLLGRPVSLARLAYGLDLPSILPRLLGHPATGAVAACLLLTATYRTSLLGLSLRSPWWHLLVLTAALGCGLAMLWPALGNVVQVRTGRGEWLGWLLPLVLCLGLFALQLRTSDRLLAAEWFLELRLGWADPRADQRLAGAVAALAAAAVSVVGMLWRPSGPPHAPPLTRPGPGHSRTSTRPSRSSIGSGP